MARLVRQSNSRSRSPHRDVQSASETLCIKVRLALNAQHVASVVIGSRGSVSQLKQLLEEPTGTPTPFQALFCDGSSDELCDEWSLHSLGLERNSELQLVRKLASPDDLGGILFNLCEEHASKQPAAFNCSRSDMRLLDYAMANGADVNAKYFGCTALQAAADLGLLEFSRKLLDDERFSEFNASDTSGFTALHIAASMGHADLCYMLLGDERIEVDAVNNCGKTALHHAIENGLSDLGIAMLQDDRFVNLDTTDEQGSTILHHASARCKPHVCHMIIRHKHFSLVDVVDNEGRTCLHRAAERGSVEVCLMILQDNRFTRVNYADDDIFGGTALHYAARADYADLCRVLLEDGRVDVNAPDCLGIPVLRYATHEHVQILLQTAMGEIRNATSKDNCPR